MTPGGPDRIPASWLGRTALVAMIAAITISATPLPAELLGGPTSGRSGLPGSPSPATSALLLMRLVAVHRLNEVQEARIAAILAASPHIGTGNPAVTHHPMSQEECRTREAAAGMHPDAEAERICGGPYMAPLYDPATQVPDDARACIDAFEFPDIPCEYPVVWARASEAAGICEAMGKRLCDAHEWEGACDGALEPPDYRFDLARGVSTLSAVERMRTAHNATADQLWSYGPAYREGVCGTGSSKNAECNGGSWAGCGSNTYPAGAFPECRSPLGVYDLNGNAAEHMNLPLSPDEMASAGSTTLGVTEMKGSWFVFDQIRAHQDWCRWRAPYWHGGRVMDPESHRNYHLGFRCCRSR